MIAATRVRLLRRSSLCLLLLSASQASAMFLADDPIIAELTEANWDQLAPEGKEVDAILGDYVLRNEHLTAVIARPGATRHANMTVRDVGGCLIDLTTNENPSDQLSAFYPGRKAFVFSRAEKGPQSLSVICDGTETALSCVVTYELPVDTSRLLITTTFTNSTKTELSLVLEDAIRADGGKELMTKSPNGTSDVFWISDNYWKQAYGVRGDLPIRSNSNARESILAYERPAADYAMLKPGDSFTLSRAIVPGQNLTFIKSAFADKPAAEVPLSIVANGVAVQGAFVTIKSQDDELGVIRADSTGKAVASLAPGEYTATVSVAGTEFPSTPLSIRDGSPVELDVPDYRFGNASLIVTDYEGRSIPCKVEFRGSGETKTPNWGPETAESFVSNLIYLPAGEISTQIAAGTYDLIISHGPEYDAAFTKLTVEAGKRAELKIRLPRMVETPGWVSADFHSHSTPSGDNTSSQLGRVLNLVAEHIEFAPCTEHNRISTYDDHIASQGLAPFLATVPGMELTGQPLPLNHQNVFPLIHKPRTQDGGAPVTDASPETQMERIAAWDNNSTKLIQQNHPDLGWLFYDNDGDQKPDEGYSRSFGLMNVMEIHPIDPLLNPTPFEIRDGKPVGNQTALNWLQLLNQGHRIYGVVNTDSHYNFHGSGGLRLWIKSSTDDPAAINADELRDASRNGHIIMSNGPYLEAEFKESGRDGGAAIAGQDLTASSGKVTANIRVQCPNWLNIDTVMVLVNGRRSAALTFTRESHPQLFHDATLRFEHQTEIALASDAHLIVLTGHRTQTVGDVMGPMWGAQHPTALNNPVFVDVDGGGFTPNRDTLDAALPVKFLAAP